MRHIVTLLLIVGALTSHGQMFPSMDENIPFLVTFGKQAPPKWGDDDNCQIFFFVIPSSQTTPFFIRIFDPDVGGEHDENIGGFDSKVSFTSYGGKRAFSEIDSLNKDAHPGFDAGNVLYKKNFGVNPKYDNNWYTMGPFNPADGSLQEYMGGYVFKLIIKGELGDDGNLYRLFLSTKPRENIALEGGNGFTFEYTFRLTDEKLGVSHIYPFVDEATISVKQHNFDVDDNTYIRIVSAAKNKLKVASSQDANWVHSTHKIDDRERGASLDFQFVKTGDQKNNNVSFYVTNQYGKFLPFYSIPIGGVPKFSYSIGAKRKK